jgi:hypothetical protein
MRSALIGGPLTTNGFGGGANTLSTKADLWTILAPAGNPAVLTLPKNPNDGDSFTVVDGNALVGGNITILPNTDFPILAAGNKATISTAYGSITFVFALWAGGWAALSGGGGGSSASLASLRNIQKTQISSAGPLATITAQGAPFATLTGTMVRLYTMFSGVTSGSGDVVAMTLLMDGAAMPAPFPPIASLNSGTPGKLFTLTNEFIITGLVPGVSHQYGYSVADLSAGTITESAGNAYIQVEEIP